MAGRRRLERKEEEKRPVVTDDFIYDEQTGDPSDNSEASVVSETPEEALRKLRRRDKAVSPGTGASAQPDDPSGSADETGEEAPVIYSSGIMLDDNLQPVRTGKKEHKAHPVLRRIVLTLITLSLILTVAAYIFHRISPTVPYLGIPENVIGDTMTPVQNFFSGLTETLFGYFRTLKLRANIEAEYNALRAENEQLTYRAMLTEELEYKLAQYEDLADEIRANANMRPIVCTIIGKSDSNYYSTFTINKGIQDGVEEYMAVVYSGGLVGYTENVQDHMATVRTIIDSDASIAALIQPTRDQGTVRGTLGIDGTPLCRMYYLPDDNLPRPGDPVVTSGVGMSFPKGIPIGTIRESTRGMESNKQYIVLEPTVDFQHLEMVMVLRYKPVAEAVEGRENGRTEIELVPVESARPSPVIPLIASSIFNTSDQTPDPNATLSPAPEATETPSPSPSPTPDLTPTPVPTPYETPLEFQVVNLRGDDPTPSPTPTYAPTSTPYFTPDPEEMTFEED